MKTKSKMVLGLSILSAATLAAGATSTFAWYGTTVSGRVYAKDASQSPVTAKALPTELAEQFGLKLTINRVRGLGATTSDPGVDTTMELTHYETGTQPRIDDKLGVEEQEDNFFFGYYIGDNVHYRTHQMSSNAEYWRLYSVKVELDVDEHDYAKDKDGNSTAYTKAEALAYLAQATSDNGFDLKVERETGTTDKFFYQSTDNTAVSGKTYYTKAAANSYSVVASPTGDQTSNYEKYAERAVFRAEANDATAPSGEYSDGSTTNGVAITSGQKVVAAGSTFYFGMYIEGEGASEDKGLVAGHFKVTASPATVDYTTGE